MVNDAFLLDVPLPVLRELPARHAAAAQRAAGLPLPELGRAGERGAVDGAGVHRSRRLPGRRGGRRHRQVPLFGAARLPEPGHHDVALQAAGDRTDAGVDDRGRADADAVAPYSRRCRPARQHRRAIPLRPHRQRHPRGRLLLRLPGHAHGRRCPAVRGAGAAATAGAGGAADHAAAGRRHGGRRCDGRLRRSGHGRRQPRRALATQGARRHGLRRRPRGGADHRRQSGQPRRHGERHRRQLPRPGLQRARRAGDLHPVVACDAHGHRRATAADHGAAARRHVVGHARVELRHRFRSTAALLGQQRQPWSRHGLRRRDDRHADDRSGPVRRDLRVRRPGYRLRCVRRRQEPLLGAASAAMAAARRARSPSMAAPTPSRSMPATSPSASSAPTPTPTATTSRAR